MSGIRTRFRLWLLCPDRTLRSVGYKVTAPGDREKAIRLWRTVWAPAWTSLRFGELEEGWKPAVRSRDRKQSTVRRMVRTCGD